MNYILARQEANGKIVFYSLDFSSWGNSTPNIQEALLFGSRQSAEAFKEADIFNIASFPWFIIKARPGFAEFSEQLANHDIHISGIQAFWNCNYTVETAIYEVNTYRSKSDEG